MGCGVRKVFAVSTRILVRKEHVIERLGVQFDNELTFPHIFKDSVLSVYPVIIEAGGRETVVVGAADAAAFAVAEGGMTMLTHGRYFSWNQGKDFEVPSFTDAVMAAATEGVLEIEADMPVCRFEPLDALRDTELFGDVVDGPGYVYTRSAKALEAVWLQTRDADVGRLRPYVETLRAGAVLSEAIADEAKGFAVLDRQMELAGIDRLLVTAAFNIEMFTGLTSVMIEDLGLMVVYARGNDEITVVSERTVSLPGFTPVGAVASRADAVTAACGPETGFEKSNMSIGLFRQFDERGLSLVDATFCLRRFFDERAGTDLLYFIAAANAVIAGFEHAKAFILRNPDATNLLEADIVGVFHQGVAAFARQIDMEGRIFAYFDIIHPGTRTPLPAMAGHYPISAQDETITFDTGLLVTDSTGVVRGCSDIARSFSRDPAIQAAYEKLRATLVDVLIPAIKPGMSGAEIHAIGVDALRPLTDELKACGMLHADMDMDGYTRDCGHTMQRQTLATVHFMPGFSGTLHETMLGCTEFVWPIDDRILACEDGYYVTPDGAVPFTI